MRDSHALTLAMWATTGEQGRMEDQLWVDLFRCRYLAKGGLAPSAACPPPAAVVLGTASLMNKLCLHASVKKNDASVVSES